MEYQELVSIELSSEDRNGVEEMISIIRNEEIVAILQSILRGLKAVSTASSFGYFGKESIRDWADKLHAFYRHNKESITFLPIYLELKDILV